MARRRHLIAALAALLAAPAAGIACDRVVLLEYDIRNGGYQFELNGVYLEHGGGQFASGGVPLEEWLLPGENVVTVRFDGEEGRFSLTELCEEGAGAETIEGTLLTGQVNADLAFAADDPPPRLFSTSKPTDDAGLADAVAALRAAYADRDADGFWALHAAMHEDLALQGRSDKATAFKFRSALEGAGATPTSEIFLRPVLGGRVWEALDAEFRPPID
ncbi:MAG: hypothetical protein AAFU55_03590, partial [Pseudomonadota bacterium]